MNVPLGSRDLMRNERIESDGQLPLRRTRFGLLVRDALGHLYDLPYLQTHLLTSILQVEEGVRASQVGLLLQRRLQETIEKLRPVDQSASLEKAWRRYRLLVLRYLEGFEIAGTCRELGISQSEYYREHRQGLDAVISLLQDDLGYADPPNIALPIPTIGYRTTHYLPKEVPLVGREEELQFLQTIFESTANDGGSSLVFLSGESGVGKTRLARDFGSHVAALGGQFIEGRYLRGGTSPYGPWVEALQSCVKDAHSMGLEETLRPYKNELAQLFPEMLADGATNEFPDVSREAQRTRFYDGVTALFAFLAEEKPLVLLLDDLQWAPGLGLLTHVSRNLKRARVMIIGAYRDQEFKENNDLVRGMAEANRARFTNHFNLEPLTMDETAFLVATFLGEGVKERIGSSIYAKTRGNPFFIEEVCRTLVDSRMVHWMDHAWQVSDSAEITIPESVKLAVRERVLLLGEETREVLSQAAVLGQQFSFLALRMFTGIEEERLVDVIERSMYSRLLTDCSIPGQEKYAFADPQVWEVLYDDISTPRRRRWHLHAGHVFEVLYSDRLADHVDELARHFLEGNDSLRAAEYAYRAGEYADRLFSWPRAIYWYKNALDLWEGLGGNLEKRAAVLEKLGDASYKSTIDAPKAIEYFKQALVIYEQLNDRRKLAAVHSQLGREYFSSGNREIIDDQKAVEHLHKAREILEGFPASPTLGLVYSGLGRVYIPLLDAEQSIFWATKALELGDRLQHPAVVANACTCLGSAYAMTGDAPEGMRYLERAWDIASTNELAFLTDFTRALGVRVSGIWLKDPLSGVGWAERRPVYQTKNDILVFRSALIGVYALMGKFTEAQAVLKEYRVKLEESAQSSTPLLTGEEGMLYMRMGRWDVAKEGLLKGIEWATNNHNYAMYASAKLQLGRLYAEQHAHKKAEQQLGEALLAYQRGDNKLHRVSAQVSLARLYVDMGDMQEATSYIEELGSVAHLSGLWRGLTGEISLANGVFQSALGHGAAAENAFESAVSCNRRYALPWDEAEAYFQWGKHLVMVDNDNSKERGRELIGRARDIWNTLGSAVFATVCDQELSAL